jgi:phosphatidylglycerophosphatase A
MARTASRSTSSCKGSTISPRQPDRAFLVSHPAHFIALGFGSGLSPKAPGTAGTLAAWPLYWLLAQFVPPLAIAFLAVPLFFLGIWACERTGRDLGASDHGAMVIDEIVAVLPLYALTHGQPLLQVAAFVLFRLFDIWKPPPIRHLEKNLEGGLGVMFDDLVAACYAYLCLIAIIAAARGALA